MREMQRAGSSNLKVPAPAAVCTEIFAAVLVVDAAAIVVLNCGCKHAPVAERVGFLRL